MKPTDGAAAPGPARRPRVSEAIGHLFAAMDELEADGLAPDGEVLMGIGEVIEKIDPCTNRG